MFAIVIAELQICESVWKKIVSLRAHTDKLRTHSKLNLSVLYVSNPSAYSVTIFSHRFLQSQSYYPACIIASIPHYYLLKGKCLWIFLVIVWNFTTYYSDFPWNDCCRDLPLCAECITKVMLFGTSLFLSYT